MEVFASRQPQCLPTLAQDRLGYFRLDETASGQGIPTIEDDSGVSEFVVWLSYEWY